MSVISSVKNVMPVHGLSEESLHFINLPGFLSSEISLSAHMKQMTVVEIHFNGL